MEKRTTKTITLGSGKLYLLEYEGEIPTNEVIETEQNLIGYIQGGAQLEYKPEYYKAEDDLGKVKKTIITKEDAKMKSGVMTWNGTTLKKFCSTGRVKEVNNVRIVKIGGIDNNDNKNYIIHFVHLDSVDGDVRLTIVGKNTAGFNLAFLKDKETVIDAEFEAIPCDDEGTLIILQESLGQDVQENQNELENA